MTRVGKFFHALGLAILITGRADAGLPTISVQDASVVEGDAGSAELRFEVIASGPPRRLALPYSVSDGTASAADGDYSPTSGVAQLTPEPARLIEHWNLGTWPTAVALAPNGDLIVADGPNSRLLRVSSTGTLLQIIGSGGQLYVPQGVAVNSAGALYVTNFDNRVVKLDANGNFVLSWGAPGSAPGQFDFPRGITVDEAGFVYVSDVVNNRVQKFDANGGFVGLWSTATAEDTPHDGPLGIDVDVQGNVYVSKGLSGRVLKYASNGALLATWTDTKGYCNGYGLHVDDAGNVLIADYHASRVVVLDDQGAFLTEWTLDEGPARSPGEFGATTIVSDHAGNVYVGSRFSTSIAHFRWNRATGTIVVPVTGDTAFEPDETLQLELEGTANVIVTDATAVGAIVNDDPDLGPNQAVNGDFEAALTGWSSYNGATLAASVDGIGGSTAARAGGSGSLSFGINDSPDIVSSTAVGARYRYSAWVRSDRVGTARLRVREYRAGALEATTQAPSIAFDGSWQRLEVTVRARTAGATLDLQVIGDFATTGQEFRVDDVAVQPFGADVPPVIDVATEVSGSWMRELVVVVSARDPEGEPIDGLEADLSWLPGASFTVAPDHAHGTLRWRPGFADVRVDPHFVTFIARNAAATAASTRIRVIPNLVGNPSFENDLVGWNAHVGATLAPVSEGRRDFHAVRVTLPTTEWAGLNDSPNWASLAGGQRTFVAGAWVRGATSRGNVRLQVREYQGGVLLGTSTSPSFDGQLTATWRRLIVSHACIASGASELDLTIDVQGSSGETFDVDDVSIVRSDGAPAVGVSVSSPEVQTARVVPNPARGDATLELSVPLAGRLRIELFDLAGRRRAVIADEPRAESGVHRFALDAPSARLTPGMYWYRASSPAGEMRGRFVVLE